MIYPAGAAEQYNERRDGHPPPSARSSIKLSKGIRRIGLSKSKTAIFPKHMTVKTIFNVSNVTVEIK